nr:NADH dehydrogenase subunit 5 [Forskalia sp.]
MIILIYILPLISFLFCCLLGRKIGRGCLVISISLIFITAITSAILFNDCLCNIYKFNINWITVINSNYNIYIDQISSSMLLLISFVSLMVHIYSMSYMEGDPHLPRFMGYLSLFTFFMIVLVTSNNLILLFVGWEGVGLCSFLLIGFWFTRILAAKAAVKAMLLNKVGDVGLLIGILLSWKAFGSLYITEIIPVLYNNLDYIALFFLIGVVGKSAQLGLHTWLPDAMEGPTPVSALIHAATMVTAGVFLIIRLAPIFNLAGITLLLLTTLGTLTTFVAATIALTANDLKKVIAYSTCSQLGYMVTICGLTHYKVALFHLLNHGFFKALLFLSAGAVIHSIHDQDIRYMGNLKDVIPFTYISMFGASLSLMGLPFLAGFYSKDLLLEMFYQAHFLSFSLWMGMFSVLLTSFYSFRLLYYTFIASPNYVGGVGFEENILSLPLFILLILSCIVGYYLKHYILVDHIPVLLPNSIKHLPSLFNFFGSFFALLIGYFLIKIWGIYFFISKGISFLSRVWFFDSLINFYSSKIMTTTFWVSYKLIDNQVLESFGPSYFYKKTSNISGRLSLSGEIITYIFLFISVFILLIILWFWGIKNNINYLYMLT